MLINVSAIWLFMVSAIALLGSPGPGIAALVAVGKARGLPGGLRFYGGLQAGLALAAAVCAAGLFSVFQSVPAAKALLTGASALYLCWLAYRIATAPVSPKSEGRGGGVAATAWSGFLLGIANPKAYIAFVSLMASYAIVPAHVSADAALKWLLCVIVMIIVDIVWLRLGVALGAAALSARAQRALNIAMGGAILVATLLAWVS
jgi:threonine/homoserine/homoserine lactone efflux protein